MSDVLDASPYDALLLLSFGGPEGLDDVVPFLENVTRGRGIPKERLKEVGQHYFLFGGVSPINDQNRALLHALRKDFAEHGLDLPVYWGNRNWAPYLTDTLRDMVRDGRRRVLVLATSAYASYSGCRQYRENLADALATLKEEGLELFSGRQAAALLQPPRLRRAHGRRGDPVARRPPRGRPGRGAHRLLHPLHPHRRRGHLRPRRGPRRRRRVRRAAPGRGPADRRRRPRAHGCGPPWQLVYQSRSGAPHIPWLEPDICDHLEERKAAGVPAVVMAPIGFVSDHMEVLYDLDTEATAKAEELGLPVRRSATVGDDPRFAAAVRELILERATAERGQDVTPCALGALGASHDLCPVGCCPARAPRPAAAGADSPYA